MGSRIFSFVFVLLFSLLPVGTNKLYAQDEAPVPGENKEPRLSNAPLGADTLIDVLKAADDLGAIGAVIFEGDENALPKERTGEPGGVRREQ